MDGIELDDVLETTTTAAFDAEPDERAVLTLALQLGFQPRERLRISIDTGKVSIPTCSYAGRSTSLTLWDVQPCEL